MRIRIAIVCVACAVSGWAQDCRTLLGAQKPDRESIQRVEAAWSDAYMHGVGAYLDCLLASDYVSVSAKGEPRDRAAIIAGAQRNAAMQADAGKSASAAKPPQPTIELYGDTAVVRSKLEADPGGKYPAMYNSDVFNFQDGAWKAIYSQHTAIASCDK